MSNQRGRRGRLDLLIVGGLAGLNLVIDKVSESSEDDEEDDSSEDTKDDPNGVARARFSAVRLADLFVDEVKVVRAVEIIETDLGKGFTAGIDDISAGGETDGTLEAVAVAGGEGFIAGILFERIIARGGETTTSARRAESKIKLIKTLGSEGIVIERSAVIPDGVINIRAELERTLERSLAV